MTGFQTRRAYFQSGPDQDNRGGVLNDLWMQIYADVNGVTFARLSLPQQMTAIGAAIMGGVGAGIWNNYEEAANLIELEKTFAPDLNKTAVYNDLYPIYRSAYPSLEALFEALSTYDRKYVG